MAIRHEQRFDVPRPPAECFAFVDDLANAPRWNPMCVELAQTSSGARAVGSALRYTFKQGGRNSSMDGTVGEHEPPRRLAFTFTDASFEIVVGFRFDAVSGGTRIEHSLETTPRSGLTRLMTPLIRWATKKQLASQSEALEKLLAR